MVVSSQLRNVDFIFEVEFGFQTRERVENSTFLFSEKSIMVPQKNGIKNQYQLVLLLLMYLFYF